MFENINFEMANQAAESMHRNFVENQNMMAHQRMCRTAGTVSPKTKFEFDPFQHGVKTSIAIGDIAKKGIDQLNAFVNEELHFLYELRNAAPQEYASTIDKMAKDVLHDYEFHKRFAVARRGF